MKLCKYCKKPGKYNSLLGKVLCEDHGDVYMNLRSVLEAITDLQLNTRSRY
tara:strand:+ start:5688 stop:5840 length:153 start_codon:yes stop_codon:yes gene_type:complete